QTLGRTRSATTPAGAVELARAESPPLSTLLALTLPSSDNFFAETILKDLGAAFAHTGTTAAGAAVVRRTIAALAGIHPQIVDGSGLSDSDRTTPYEVVQLIATTYAHTLQDHMAITLARSSIELAP